MYLKKYNLHTLLFISLVFFFSSACKEESTPTEKNKKADKSELSFEERAKRAVEADLKINASEKYDIQIHSSYIDRDTLKDAVILVNRKQWAFERIKKNNNESFAKKTGYTEPYNNVFVYLGKYDKFISTPTIGSSAEYPLEVNFEVITNPSQKDFYIDYRIRNSMKRNYYSVRNDRVFMTFNCPVFDSIGAPKPKVYSIEHQESTVRLAKDIVLYEGEIPGYDPSKIENTNYYSPEEIVSTDELYVFFIFDKNSMSYVTPMVSKEKEE